MHNRNSPIIANSALGSSLLLIGLVFNVWVVGKFFSAHGEVSSILSKLIVCFFDFLCISIGFLLLRYRKTFKTKNLIFTLIIVMLCLILSELFLTLYGRKPLKKVILTVPELEEGWLCDDLEGNRYIPEKMIDANHLNRNGFRDNDDFIVKEYDQTSWRILLLGDSFVYGAAAYEKGKSFAELIEKDMNKLNETIIWNTGIPGTGQRQEYFSLTKYFSMLKPQLVIVGFYENDFSDNLYPIGNHYVFKDGSWVNRYEITKTGRVKILTPEKAYKRALQPNGLIEYILVTRLGSMLVEASTKLDQIIKRKKHKETSDKMGNSATLPEPDCTAGKFKVTFDLMTKIDSYVSNKGSKLIVLIIPSKADMSGLGTKYINMRCICEAVGIEYIEVLDILDKMDYVADGHWTVGAHQKVSYVIEERAEDFFRQGKLK